MSQSCEERVVGPWIARESATSGRGRFARVGIRFGDELRKERMGGDASQVRVLGDRSTSLTTVRSEDKQSRQNHGTTAPAIGDWDRKPRATANRQGEMTGTGRRLPKGDGRRLQHEMLGRQRGPQGRPARSCHGPSRPMPVLVRGEACAGGEQRLSGNL